MEFLTIRAESYDAALRKAHEKYGISLRVQWKRDYEEGRWLKKKRWCEIGFYLVASPDLPASDEHGENIVE